MSSGGGDGAAGGAGCRRVMGAGRRAKPRRVHISVDDARCDSIHSDTASADLCGKAAGEHFDGAFGHRIADDVWAGVSCRTGRDVDDPTAVTHPGQCTLCDEERGTLVYRPSAFVSKVAIMSVWNKLAIIYAGVVDKNVDTFVDAEIAYGTVIFAPKLLVPVGRGQVRLDSHGSASGIADSVDDRVGSFRIGVVVDDDIDTGFGERSRDGRADAAAAPVTKATLLSLPSLTASSAAHLISHAPPECRSQA